MNLNVVLFSILFIQCSGTKVVRGSLLRTRRKWPKNHQSPRTYKPIPNDKPNGTPISNDKPNDKPNDKSISNDNRSDKDILEETHLRTYIDKNEIEKRHLQNMDRYTKLGLVFQAFELSISLTQMVMSQVSSVTKALEDATELKKTNKMTLESKNQCESTNESEHIRCYTINIGTANEKWAGTNGAVYIKLYHTNKNATLGSLTFGLTPDVDKSSYIHLNNPGDDFERGRNGTYYILGPNIGEIDFVRLKHHGRNDKWIVKNISVDNKPFCIDGTYSFSNDEESFKLKSNEPCL